MTQDNKNTTTQATCADCGVKFELPFTPTSNKPVYCNDCFRNKRKQGGQDNRRGQDNRNRPRQMFSATCDKCGQKCEVPFRPSSGKPIFCDKCFSKNKPTGGGRQGDQLRVLNEKIDTIFNALVTAKIIKLPKAPKPVKETKKPVGGKESPVKKAPAKKTATKKKPVAKKKAPAPKGPQGAKKKATPKKK